jgi:hypothetical protein
MKKILAMLATVALSGCGVETAATAASAASIRKQEMEQAQKTLEQAQEKIDGAMRQMQQRAETAGQ